MQDLVAPVSINALHFEPCISIGKVVPHSVPITTCSIIPFYVFHDNDDKRASTLHCKNIFVVNIPYLVILPGFLSVVIAPHLILHLQRVVLQLHYLTHHQIFDSHPHQFFLTQK